MRPTLVLDILLLAPLGLALFATAQLLAPVRRAFARRAPELPLLPGETVIATLRPDSRVLIVPGLALLLPLSTSDPASALGLAAHERIAGLIHIGTESASAPERPRPDLDAKTTWISA